MSDQTNILKTLQKVLTDQSQLKKAIDIIAVEHKSVWTIEDLATYTGYTKEYLYKLTSPQGRHPNPPPFHKPSGKKQFGKREELLEWLVSNNRSEEAEIEELILPVHHKTRQS